MSPPRVLVVYGSESGNSMRNAKRIARGLPEEYNVAVSTGDDVALQIPEGLMKTTCDVIIVVTSSHGEGDPPENMRAFLLELVRTAGATDKPLAGLQHAVLGFGSSSYENFQTVPRLTDKLMDECGSRRLITRSEVDMEGDQDSASYRPPSAIVADFEEKVLAALKSLPAATSPAACAWTTPASKILEKSESGDAARSDRPGCAFPLTFSSFESLRHRSRRRRGLQL